MEPFLLLFKSWLNRVIVILSAFCTLSRHSDKREIVYYEESISYNVCDSLFFRFLMLYDSDMSSYNIVKKALASSLAIRGSELANARATSLYLRVVPLLAEGADLEDLLKVIKCFFLRKTLTLGVMFRLDLLNFFSYSTGLSSTSPLATLWWNSLTVCASLKTG